MRSTRTWSRFLILLHRIDTNTTSVFCMSIARTDYADSNNRPSPRRAAEIIIALRAKIIDSLGDVGVGRWKSKPAWNRLPHLSQENCVQRSERGRPTPLGLQCGIIMQGVKKPTILVGGRDGGMEGRRNGGTDGQRDRGTEGMHQHLPQI